MDDAHDTDAGRPAEPPGDRSWSARPSEEEARLGPLPLSMPPFGPVPPWPPRHTGPPPQPPQLPRRRRHRLVTGLAAVLVVFGGLGAGLGIGLGSGGPNGAVTEQHAPTATESVAQIAADVDPAVVDITTDLASEAGSGIEQAAGTGMILDSSGLVLTNNHVIANATHIAVELQGTARTYRVTVLGESPKLDVALLRLDGAKGLPHVVLGDSGDVQIGDPVVAIGNALGLGHQPSNVTGSVASLERTINASDSGGESSETLHGLIETDAAIVPGDSGGPLVNRGGEVIGMDTAAASADGSNATLGFAIPVNEAVAVAHEIESGKAAHGVVIGESAYLGVLDETFGGTSPSDGGAPVSAVINGSPADRAGLGAGDTIVSLAGTAVRSFAKLQDLVATHTPGDAVALVYRDGSGTSHHVRIRLGGIPR